MFKKFFQLNIIIFLQFYEHFALCGQSMLPFIKSSYIFTNQLKKLNATFKTL